MVQHWKSYNKLRNGNLPEKEIKKASLAKENTPTACHSAVLTACALACCHTLFKGAMLT